MEPPEGGSIYRSDERDCPAAAIHGLSIDLHEDSHHVWMALTIEFAVSDC